MPDRVIRWGIRRLLALRLRQEQTKDEGLPRGALQRFIDESKKNPIAMSPEKANEQHYELPSNFFTQILGKRLKYSSGYWPSGVTTLDAAEEAMLRLTCERAQIQDGMKILELGCGWGSLTLWLAEYYPNSQITAVSNSISQRAFIEMQCVQHGWTHVRVVTADMNEFATAQRFDRVVSVEMFEHMRNYERLLARVASWLKTDGKLFVHIFCHRSYTYPFEAEGEDNWMGRYFFSGGIMPADDLLLYFTTHVVLEKQWRVNGQHYAYTAEAWLKNFDAQQAKITPILETVYGTTDSLRWLLRWRIFFMACAELFAYRQGQEWWVSHYLFRRHEGGREG